MADAASLRLGVKLSRDPAHVRCAVNTCYVCMHVKCMHIRACTHANCVCIQKGVRVPKMHTGVLAVVGEESFEVLWGIEIILCRLALCFLFGAAPTALYTRGYRRRNVSEPRRVQPRFVAITIALSCVAYPDVENRRRKQRTGGNDFLPRCASV